MELEVQLHTFLTLVQDAGEWSAACSGHFTAGYEKCMCSCGRPFVCNYKPLL